MAAISLPKHLETWAEAEVAAGRAESVVIGIISENSGARVGARWRRAFAE